jgi:hypothetical protein
MTAEDEIARDIEDAAQAETQTPEYIEVQKEAEAALLLGRAVAATLLDGHWITLRALNDASIATGIPTLDSAVSADDRPAFDQFFRDQVKARR